MKNEMMKSFVLVVAMSLLIPNSLFDVRASSPNDDPPVSFSGTWKTIAAGTHQYTVILKQTDNEVTGSFSPGNGKIFDGVVKDRKLTFKWSQDGGFEGTGEFTLDQDGKGFTGSSTSLKPNEVTNTWNTYKPEPVSFAGNWETISDGQNSVPLTIVQKGDRVTGLYPGNNGKIEGTVTGNVLRFKWESDGGSGSGRFVMDQTTMAFSGTYNRGDNPDDVDSTWNGTRQAYTGGKLQSSFAGEWQLLDAKGGPSQVLLVLIQDGNKVTGQTRFANAPKNYLANVVYVREGIVVGNKLTFKLTQLDGKVLALGELVMDAGGKSFKGKIGDNITRASFVRP